MTSLSGSSVKAKFSLKRLSSLFSSRATPSTTPIKKSPLSVNSTLPLLSGAKLPQLGFGVFQTPPEETAGLVAEALKVGYRHIDTAAMYQNEKGSFQGVKKSDLPRSEVFFTTKIAPGLISYEGVKCNLEASFKEAEGIEYFDLVLLHAPSGTEETRNGAWRALSEAKDAGKVRDIGVSNFGVKHLNSLEKYVKANKLNPISVGQWEIHPWLVRKDIQDWCKARNIVVQAYSPLVRGTRSEEPVLKELSNKYRKSWSQILIRWSLQNGLVPLPKSVTLSRIASNADVYDFEISKEDIARLTTDKYESCLWDPTVWDDAPLTESSWHGRPE